MLFSMNASADFGNDLCFYKAETSKEVLNVPVKADEITTLQDISCTEGVPSTLQFQYEVSRYFNDENKVVANTFMKKSVYPKLNQTWCTTPSFFQTVELFDVEFIYKDLHGAEFSRHKITLRDCAPFIKK